MDIYGYIKLSFLLLLFAIVMVTLRKKHHLHWKIMQTLKDEYKEYSGFETLIRGNMVQKDIMNLLRFYYVFLPIYFPSMKRKSEIKEIENKLWLSLTLFYLALTLIIVWLITKIAI